MRSVFLALFAISFFGFGAFAQSASPSTCLDAGRVQSVLQEYAFKSWNPRIPPKGGWQTVTAVDLCDPQDLIHQAIESLLFIEDFPAFNFPKDDFDLNVIGDSPIDFFRSRIHTVEFETTGSTVSCGQSTVAYVMGSGDEPNTMHVCPYATNFTSLLLASILMHEARHIDGFPHTMCLTGLYQDTFACDATYATGGSYAVGVEFFVKTSRAFADDPAVHDEARAEAISDLLVRFNEAPLGITEGALALSTTGDLSFFDGTTTTTVLSGVPATTKVVLRDILAFFDTLTGSVKGYSGTPTLTDIKGPFAQSYRDMDPSRQRQLLDAEYGSLDCLLFTDSVVCSRGGDNRADIKLPDGAKPIQFMPLNGPASGLFYIVAENGETYGLPPSEDLRTWTTQQIYKNDIKNLDLFQSLVLFQKTLRYAVDRNGTVLFMANDPSASWTPAPQFLGQKIQSLQAPFFWSSRVIQL